MSLDMSTKSDGILLPKEISSQIWQDAQDSSAVMRFTNRIDLPAAGVTIPIVTGDPDAQWVNETDEIAVDKSEVSSRSITGYKLGVIEPFSKEFKRDLPGLYNVLADRLPNAIARKFDSTVFHATTAPGADFDLLSGVASLPLTSGDAYDNLVEIDGAVAEANGVLSGYALAPSARGLLLRAKDADGRPLLINDVQRQGAVTGLLGADVALSRPVYRAAGSTPGVGDVLGFAGDWSAASYGVVQDIRVEMSDQATITIDGEAVNLWQRDMFALKVTAYLGFVVRDSKKFVKVVRGTEPVVVSGE